MLFILAGDIQTGKTRWLTSLVEELTTGGVLCSGVLLPGIWQECEDAYEKQGIEAVLLPQGTRIPYARRRDLDIKAGNYDTKSQSALAQLGWAIDDKAIAIINRHFEELSQDSATHGLLVVDELGPLELRDGKGFTEAVALLDRCSLFVEPVCKHALVVVRTNLIDRAKERFAGKWDIKFIAPDEESRQVLLQTFQCPTMRAENRQA